MYLKNTDRNSHINPSGRLLSRTEGFTLIELMIVVAVIAIIMTLAIPTYSNYSIRSKMSAALSQIEDAKTAANSICQKDGTITQLSNDLAGYDFKPSKYVKNIDLGGGCEVPTITMKTAGTGAKPNPVLTFTGSFADNIGQITWTCVGSGLNIHLPDSCRS